MRAFDMLEAVLTEEFNDFQENFSSKREEEKINLVNNQGDVIVPLTIDREVFEKINNTIDSRLSINVEDYAIDAKILFNSINDNVKIVRDVDAVKGLKFIFKYLVENAENSKFAGILIINRRTGFVFNPVHPFNIFLIKSGKVNLPEKFDIFIFEFNTEENELNLIDEAYKMHLLYYTLFKNHMLENIEYKMNIINAHHNFDNILFLNDIDAKIDVEKRISKNFKSIAFPLQVLSKGELVPYMGWGAISAEIRAIPLYGNGSGNLKSYYYSSNNDVCTGNKSNQSIEGWYTLSKINFNSTWFNHYLNVNYRDIFLAGHILARDILTGKIDEILNTQNQQDSE